MLFEENQTAATPRKVVKSSTAAGGLLADLADWRTLPGGLGGLADLADWRTWRTRAWRTWRTGGLGLGGLWRTLGRLWRTLADSGQALADSGGLGGLGLNPGWHG